MSTITRRRRTSDGRMRHGARLGGECAVSIESAGRLCPMCGNELHELSALDECPWWRFVTRFGDPAMAVDALPLLTGVRAVGAGLEQELEKD